MKLNFCVVGLGEIAEKAHIPAIHKLNPNAAIAALVDIDPRRREVYKTIPTFSSVQDAAEKVGSINAASICTPPHVTVDLAFQCVNLGLHTLIEKPPGDYKRLPDLLKLAKKKGVTVYTAYHTTACPGFNVAKEWIDKNNVEKIQIRWMESARKWHLGQQWLTTEQGRGVLDPMFNPLSLLVAALEQPPVFCSADLIRPSNWGAPISGTLALHSDKNVSIEGHFAMDYEPSSGPAEIWEICFSTPQGQQMVLQEGGAQAYIAGKRVTKEPTASFILGPEYDNLYRNFSGMVTDGESYVDVVTPRLLDEIFEKGKYETGPPYDIGNEFAEA